MSPTANPPDPVIAFLIALDRSDTEAMRRIRRVEPDLFRKLRADHRWIVCDAARKSSPEAVRVLIELGAPIDEQDSNSFTGLCWAVSYGRYDVVRVLLECGADPNLDCPLFRVASSDKVQDRIAMAELLLKHGADVNQPFLVEGLPPRDAVAEARARRLTDLAEFLESRGAKRSAAPKRKNSTRPTCRPRSTSRRPAAGPPDPPGGDGIRLLAVALRGGDGGPAIGSVLLAAAGGDPRA